MHVKNAVFNKLDVFENVQSEILFVRTACSV